MVDKIKKRKQTMPTYRCIQIICCGINIGRIFLNRFSHQSCGEGTFFSDPTRPDVPEPTRPDLPDPIRPDLPDPTRPALHAAGPVYDLPYMQPLIKVF